MTEIAKVVSGRTDNAVKNRFSTLCKKKAKREALANENCNAYINVNNKRTLIASNGFQSQAMVDISSPHKKLRREHIPNPAENITSGNIMLKDCGLPKQHSRPPFAVLAQNVRDVDNGLVSSVHEKKSDKNTEGTFLRKDNPKVAALVQQVELLSSLAIKVNMDNNAEQSLENAWQVLQNFFGRSKENEETKHKLSDIDFQLDDLRDIVEDLRNSNKDIQSFQRQPDAYASPSSSEYSTASTNVSACDGREHSQAEISTMHDDIGAVSQSMHIAGNVCVDIPCEAIDRNNRRSEFSSPLQVTPIFRSLALTIPSPQFSESERHFLHRTLGIESPHNTITNPLQSPPCRKALLQGL